MSQTSHDTQAALNPHLRNKNECRKPTVRPCELAAAIPENRSAYEKLLPAAAELRESRRRHLTDAQIQAIATGFDRAVGPEWSARFPHTGTLLGCAVADELEGSELAVESLRPWRTDATRSPPHGSQRWRRPLPRRARRPGAPQPPMRSNPDLPLTRSR